MLTIFQASTAGQHTTYKSKIKEERQIWNWETQKENEIKDKK